MNYKWISAAEIDAWTQKEPRRAQEILPKLIIKLILASSDKIDFFNFPSGKSIQYSGYDGILRLTTGNNYLREGQSVWEFGTDANILSKFNDDFVKRTNDPLGIIKSDSVFVFVTSRIWYHRTSISEQIETAKSSSEWKDIVIIDANYLEEWLESCYSVAVWFSNIIGKNLGNYTSLEQYWNDMVKTTNPVLKKEFFLYGRTAPRDEILSWIESNEKHLVLSADSTLEALLFFISIFIEPDNLGYEEVMSNSLIVLDEESWKNSKVFDNDKAILIPFFSDTHKIQSVEKAKVIHLVSRYSPLVKIRDNYRIIDISKQRKNDFENALKEIGVEAEEHSKMVFNTKRSFMALYRLLTTVPSRKTPMWLDDTNIDDLIPALFLGGWDDSFSGDVALIETLAGENYLDYLNRLTKWLTIEDPPLIKIDHRYFIVSVPDLWNIFWNRINEAIYTKLCSTIPVVFSVNDPTYELKEEQWFAASIFGKSHKYSQALLDGLVITMVMLAERDGEENLFNSFSTKNDVDKIVKKILEEKLDWQGWYTIANHIPLLIEASPNSVLSKLENEVISEDIEFWKMFDQPKDLFMGRTFYTHILWALEKVSWDKEYVVRAINILVKLVEKRFDYKLANTPLNTLYNMFCLWHPQNCLTQDEHIIIIDGIVKKYPYAGWELIRILLPDNHQISSNICKPRWKECDYRNQEALTQMKYFDLIKQVKNVALKYLTADIGQWKIILNKVNWFLDEFDILFELCTHHLGGYNPEERMDLADILGQAIYRYRKFSNAEWSITEENVLKIVQIYTKIKPEGPHQYYYLFKYNPYILTPTSYENEKYDFEAERKVIFDKRRDAIKEINDNWGIEELYKMLSLAEDVHEFSNIFVMDILNYEFNPEVVFDLKEKSLRFFTNVITGIYQKQGFDYFKQLFSDLDKNEIMDILTSLPAEEDIWNYLDESDEEIQRYYWENISASCLYNQDTANTEYLIDKFLENNRPYTLIDTLAYSAFNNIEYIIKILQKVLEQYPEPEKNGMEFKCIPAHDIVHLFEKLYDSEKLNEELIAQLELAYLPVFDHDYNLRCLSTQLAKNPNLFVELLALAYKSDDHKENIEDDNAERASRAYNLLKRFKLIPGCIEKDITVDQEVFNKWFLSVMEISEGIGYKNAFEICIGELLSYSPLGSDGVWPHEIIREFLEEHGTENIGQHFIIGKRNQRGVYNVTGGREEIQIARRYEEYADKMMFEFPKTASLIRKISDSYFADAKLEEKREMREFY